MPNIYRANYSSNENRGGTPPPQNQKPNKSHNKKSKPDFKTLKCNTIKSLNDVEYFLNNFGKILKTVKLYKLLK